MCFTSLPFLFCFVAAGHTVSSVPCLYFASTGRPMWAGGTRRPGDHVFMGRYRAGDESVLAVDVMGHGAARHDASIEN